MDDILASIRKIISEDEAQAKAGGIPAASPAAEVSADADVLLLTEVIEDPKAAATEPAATFPSTPAPVPAESPAPTIAEEVAMTDAQPQPASDAGLVAAAVAGAASSAFARLNQVVQESVPVPAAPDPGPSVTAGGKTIEEMVKDMLRPMLKEWLDANLPSIVERYVEREVVRLTRR